MSGGGNLPVGPGIWGFVAFFVLAVALWFLVRNMNSRLRRMAYRDRDRAEQFAANADVDGRRRPSPRRRASDPPSRPRRGRHRCRVRRTDDDTRPDGEDPRP